MSQKLLETAKNSAMDAVSKRAIQKVSKRAIQNTAETTGDLIGYKTADEITSVSKKSPKELPSKNEDKIEIPKERYISPEKRQQIIDELRLV